MDTTPGHRTVETRKRCAALLWLLGTAPRLARFPPNHLVFGDQMTSPKLICDLHRDWQRKETAQEFAKTLFSVEGF
jgi:hypothetical protein